MRGVGLLRRRKGGVRSDGVWMSMVSVVNQGAALI